jgi:CheY-like chemotaxis protein
MAFLLHILVVDDDFEVAHGIARSVRQVARVDFRPALEGVLISLRDGERYDLIVCGLTMTERSGVDVYDRVIAEFPSTRDVFVFVSGGADDQVLLDRVRATGRPLLEKPIGGDELVALTRRR